LNCRPDFLAIVFPTFLGVAIQFSRVVPRSSHFRFRSASVALASFTVPSGSHNLRPVSSTWSKIPFPCGVSPVPCDPALAGGPLERSFTGTCIPAHRSFDHPLALGDQGRPSLSLKPTVRPLPFRFIRCRMGFPRSLPVSRPSHDQPCSRSASRVVRRSLRFSSLFFRVASAFARVSLGAPSLSRRSTVPMSSLVFIRCRMRFPRSTWSPVR
jgi:hypothetical protein